MDTSPLSSLWQQLPVPMPATGIGIRSEHYADVLQQRPALAWLEALTDNYLGKSGPQVANLFALREHYPMTLHGVNLSLASTEPLDQRYLSQLQQMIDDLQPAWVSDHLAWTQWQGKPLHELMPVPFNEAVVSHLSERIGEVQERLKRPILVENLSSYMSFDNNSMSEWDFVSSIAKHSGCFILLDVNNIYVNAINHGFDPKMYIDAMPADRVAQIHLGGYEDQGDYLLDTHGAAVYPEVWKLYQYTIKKLGPRPTLIEWDNNLPPLADLLQQANQAQQIQECYGTSTISTTVEPLA